MISAVMKSTLQFLKIIGCIVLLSLGALAFVNACFSSSWVVNNLGGISEDLRDHCKYTLTWRG